MARGRSPRAAPGLGCPCGSMWAPRNLSGLSTCLSVHTAPQGRAALAHTHFHFPFLPSSSWGSSVYFQSLGSTRRVYGQTRCIRMHTYMHTHAHTGTLIRIHLCTMAHTLSYVHTLIQAHTDFLTLILHTHFHTLIHTLTRRVIHTHMPTLMQCSHAH